MTEQSTWQRARDVVSWSFLVPAAPGETPSATFLRTVRESLAALDGLGQVTQVSLTTASAGEGAREVSGSGASVDHVLALLRENPDTVAVECSIELACISADGSPIVIPRGAYIRIEADEDDQEVYLYLALNVDIYAWRTWALVRDNSQLAALNSPRLSYYLSQLRDKLDARIDRIDNNSYDVDETGFIRA